MRLDKKRNRNLPNSYDVERSENIPSVVIVPSFSSVTSVSSVADEFFDFRNKKLMCGQWRLDQKDLDTYRSDGLLKSPFRNPGGLLRA